MRALEIYRNGILAGVLMEESRQHYIFKYDEQYFLDAKMPSLILTLDKTQQQYESNFLFPFFFHMISEGVNRKLQSLQLKIDEDDHFALLAATAQNDTIGAVTVKPLPLL